uniref:Uncharacterized protein n=1 Tax=Arundo donax TaxID=35708 RepID=A0A0A9B056_ARUDO
MMDYTRGLELLKKQLFIYSSPCLRSMERHE